MRNEVLAIRAKPDNPNHNLWLNHGTWGVAFTTHLPDRTKKRVRISLGTKEVATARQRRDTLFASYQAKPANGNQITPAPVML